MEEWTAVGWAQFTDLSAAVSIAEDAPDAGTSYADLTYGANNHKVYPEHAVISIEGADVRYHDNGDTPTAAEGTPAQADGYIVIGEASKSPDSIRNFKIIEQSASASITVRYYIS